MDSNENVIPRLLPNLSERDQMVLEAYDGFHDRYHLMLNEQIRRALIDNPVLGPVIQSRSTEEQMQQITHSRQLQKEAIHNNRWDNYTTNLFEQGVAYAKAGLSFSDWFDIVKVFRDHAQPLILEHCQHEKDRLTNVLEGLNKMVDFGLKVIAESYLLTMNELIKKGEERHNMVLNQLKASEERFRVLFESSLDHIYLIDKHGMIQYVNRVRKGLVKDAVIGTSFFDHHSLKDRRKIEKAINRVIKTGKPIRYDSEILEGEDIEYYSCSANPVFHESEVEWVAIIARNTTEKVLDSKKIRELNEDLERKVAKRTTELEAINQELESFSYTVSHDLRAPIRAIDGFTKVLVKKLVDRLDEREQHYLDVIIENTGKMGQLIDDLLAFSRMGRLEKKTIVFDMDLLVDQVFKEMTQDQDLSRITLTINPLPKARADREMIKVVLSNLIGNAIKFTSKRTHAVIEIGAEEGENLITYYVKDNGVGFEMEYIDKLFGIFQRLHSDDEFEGTGVGLAIVQRIIHRHGGEVWATSELHQNATFYFSIPKP